MLVNSGLYPILIVGGIAVVVYGSIGNKPFYNDVELPRTELERNDSRPPSAAERAGYVGFGALLVLFGLWKLL